MILRVMVDQEVVFELTVEGEGELRPTDDGKGNARLVMSGSEPQDVSGLPVPVPSSGPPTRYVPKLRQPGDPPLSKNPTLVAAVLKARAEGRKLKEIAAQFGVPVSLCWRISSDHNQTLGKARGGNRYTVGRPRLDANGRLVQRVCELYQSGMTMRDISAKTNISTSAVSKILHHHLERG